MAQSLRQYVNSRFTELQSERSSWMAHWQDLSNYIEPRIGRYMTGGNNKGSKKNGTIINSTATFSLRVLTAGLMTGLTSPARPWFKVGLSDIELNKHRQNKLWLDEVERILLTIFRKSNVYQSLISIYEEIALTGTGCMFVEQDDANVINTNTLTVGEYYFGIGANGHVDTMCREFRKTVKQMVEKYGFENCSTTTQNLYKNDKLENWIDVRNLIEPNRQRRDGSYLAKDKPFASFHWEVSANENSGDEGFLLRSGFDEFPIMPPRWDVKSSDVYGRSPAMDILGDVKQLQSQEKTKAKAQAKLVDPPMVGDANIHPSQTNTAPSGFTATVSVNGAKSFVPAYQIDPKLGEFTHEIEKVEKRIQRGMYEDLFLAISNLDDVRSATEVIERKQEKLLMLGPVIERVQVELLDNLITRTFAIANRMGLIPEPPEEISDAQLEIEYISPLAQAQKALATGTIERLGNYVAQLAAINPDAIDKFDADESINLYAEALGASPKLIKSNEKVAQQREDRAKQIQEQQQMEAMPQAVQSAKTLSESGDAGQDVVDRVLGGIGR
jgi:hypothetical protein